LWTASVENIAAARATAARTERHGGVRREVRAPRSREVYDHAYQILAAKEFGADEATIDEIWGSFEMWSGGASGESY
jgi:hypothetical protein